MARSRVLSRRFKGALTYTNVVTAYIRIPIVSTPLYYADPSRDAGRQGNLLIRDALDILKAQPNYQTEVLPRLRELTLERGEAVALNVLYTGDEWRRMVAGLVAALLGVE